MKPKQMDEAGLEERSPVAGGSSPCIGRIVGAGNSGDVLVTYRGGRPAAARIVSGVKRRELLKEENLGREILLLFEEGDFDRPIIIGMMEDTMEELVALALDNGGSRENAVPMVDGSRVVIEAKEEVVLKCGSGSITLRKDGKIIIKGTHLLSRASGPIRVKGARVDIN